MMSSIMITLNKYNNNLRLFFSDIDSLVYEIKKEGVYEQFTIDKKMFAFDIYSAQSKYYNSNKLAVGKIKDERCGAAIKEFVELNSKMY